MYLTRTLEKSIIELSKEWSCILLFGPRRVGKSTLIRHIIKDENREHITLDSINERELAKKDPEMFFSIHKPPIAIDEIQYAPELFSYIKILIDNGAKPGSFLLTGSQSFHLMKLAKESLAGRVGLIHMSGLSQSEIFKTAEEPFIIDVDSIKKRVNKSIDVEKVYELILNGSMPALISGEITNREFYYDSYIDTYIDRDVAEELTGIDKYLFKDFIRACACRVAQIVNVHSIATDIGVTDDTAKRWLHILEKSEIIYFLNVYSNNLLKRTIKTPKLYMFDTGLVAHITKYKTYDSLMNGAINGAILENYCINEIRKTYMNNCKISSMYYYRDKDNNEVDLIIDEGNIIYPIEIKKTCSPNSKMINGFKVLNKLTSLNKKGAIVCLSKDLSAIDANNLIVPIGCI